METLPYKKLLKYWEQTNSEMTIGPQQEEGVANLERKYGVHFPPDFRAYLVHACPIAGCDQNFTEWWTVENIDEYEANIKNFPDECDHNIENSEIAIDAEYYIFFADYAIWAWAWAICCKPGENYGRIAIFGLPERFVADSFEAFVDAFIQGWEHVS